MYIYIINNNTNIYQNYNNITYYIYNFEIKNNKI